MSIRLDELFILLTQMGTGTRYEKNLCDERTFRKSNRIQLELNYNTKLI